MTVAVSRGRVATAQHRKPSAIGARQSREGPFLTTGQPQTPGDLQQERIDPLRAKVRRRGEGAAMETWGYCRACDRWFCIAQTAQDQDNGGVDVACPVCAQSPGQVMDVAAGDHGPPAAAGRAVAGR